ncbi:MAG TPA: ABC transporter permease [Vicinamibacterales bacterium]|nr:ABC transporter permease [Vicinamibacterales bacterium]
MGDLKLAARALTRNPGFAAAALVTLALGIGATTAIFTIVHALLLSPLPYKDPDRLMIVWERNIPRNRPDNVVSPGNYLHWRERTRTFDQLAGISPNFRGTLSGAGAEPEELPLQYVSANFFPLLDVKPAMGRWFREEEDRSPRTAMMISHRLWQLRFGGDRGVVNRTVRLNGEPMTIVGVMPEGFSFLFRDIDVWVPLGLPASARTPRGRWMIVLGHLRPGVTVAQAQADMDAIHAALRQEFPDFNTGWATTVVPLNEQLTGKLRPALLILLAAVACVLLIACANVANLLLARGTVRRRELAIRAALGAARGRIVRQLLTESILLSLAGGALGLLLAWWGVAALKTVVAATIPLFPRLDEIGVDPVVLGFTVLLSAATGVLFGLAPAFMVSRTDLQESLREGGRSGSAREGLARSAFIVAQVALALVLLAGAGLLIRSFARLMGVDPGFAADRAMTAKVSVSGDRYKDEARVKQFFNELFDGLGRAPGVRAAGGVSFLPMNGMAAATGFSIEGREPPPLGQGHVCEVRVVAGDYFGAMRIPLMAGRTFTRREQTEKANVVLVNETLAKQYFPDGAIGQRIVVSWNTSEPDEIIGVVGDVRTNDLETAARATIYWPQGRFSYPWTTAVVRTDGDPSAAAPLIREQVRAVDPGVPVADVRPLAEVVSRSVAQRRLTMVLLATFAGVALMLAAVGIYGVMSYLVAQRTREIGVRMALGARGADVLRMVLGRALGLAVIGVALGIVAAWAVTRSMTPLLYQTEPGDPFILAAVAGVLIVAALVASYLPGRLATRVDPLVALRAE